MMTGRDMIMYILENHLEDEPVVDRKGKFVGFISEEEAAVKFGVGYHTVRVWVNQGKIPGVLVNEVVYIPENAKRPEGEI